MARQVSEVRPINKHKYSNYLRKAEEYLEGAHSELGRKCWNFAALGAIHGAISACDALTIFYLGQKHKGQKHSDAARLFSNIKELPAAEIKEKSNLFIGILDLKTSVEYTDEIFSEGEGREIVKKADRFLEWVKGKLPPS